MTQHEGTGWPSEDRVDMGVRLPQDKEQLEQSETGRGKEGPPLEPSGGA